MNLQVGWELKWFKEGLGWHFTQGVPFLSPTKRSFTVMSYHIRPDSIFRVRWQVYPSGGVICGAVCPDSLHQAHGRAIKPASVSDIWIIFKPFSVQYTFPSSFPDKDKTCFPSLTEKSQGLYSSVNGPVDFTPLPLALLEAPQNTFPIPAKVGEWAMRAQTVHTPPLPTDIR